MKSQDEKSLKAEIEELEDSLADKKELERLRAERDQLRNQLFRPGEQYSVDAVCPACQKPARITVTKAHESEQSFHCPHNPEHTFSGAGAIRAKQEAEEAMESQGQIKALKNETEQLKREVNLKKLRDRKTDLEREAQSYGKEYNAAGYCPVCRKPVDIKVKRGREAVERISCPYNSEHSFTAEEAIKTKHAVPSNRPSAPAVSQGEFNFQKELDSFRNYTILSIFLDFFLIFTILGFSQKGKLAKYIRENSQSIHPEQEASFNSWKSAFIAIFWIKIAMLGCSFIMYMSSSTY